jgi:hypothetical protein
MNNHILHETPFDPIELEAKLDRDYRLSQQTEKFCFDYREEPRTSFEDGKYDGELNLEPEPHQWFTPSYRRGYESWHYSKERELNKIQK